jgi:hypothetical protein
MIPTPAQSVSGGVWPRQTRLRFGHKGLRSLPRLPQRTNLAIRAGGVRARLGGWGAEIRQLSRAVSMRRLGERSRSRSAKGVANGTCP